nr:g-type lectin s-receptor-like serine/threonine-protein kinase lecrk1 [Quercus suber]
MTNGSLADLLFKAKKRPLWEERVRIALEVARGIYYLHQECEVHIIHCNLKPENILMDDTWTAKISNFGLAGLSVPNQTRTTMGIEGTSGYSAPEWQKNALISVKADIYSFGVMLLEIVCCRSNIEVNVSTADEILLSSWVYNCFVVGELDKLVEEENVDMKTLERMVKVGLWCIQEDPALRPPMKNSGYQQGSSKEHDRLEDDLKLIGEAQNFEEGTRVENERVQKGVAKGRSCSSTFKNGGGEKELELTGFEVVGQRWRQYRI